MTADQSNELAMYHAVQVFLTEFLNSTTATGQFPSLGAKLALLNAFIDQITEYAKTQDAPLTVAIVVKDAAMEHATTEAIAVAGALLSYARTHGKPDLMHQARISPATFGRIRQGERMRRAQVLHDLAQNVLPELADFGLTAARLAEFQSAITSAETAVNERVSRAAAKKVATAEIERLSGEARALLATIDPMLVRLGRSDPAKYALYRAARTVFDHPGTRSPEEEETKAATAETGAVTTAASGAGATASTAAAAQRAA